MFKTTVLDHGLKLKYKLETCSVLIIYHEFCCVVFQDVFNCMLKNLFEEYKFFPQYPDKELQITAQLFGGIMEHGLVG